MTENRWETVWERVRAGRHTLVIGPSTVPSVPSDLKALQVDCAESPAGGVLDEVLAALEKLFGPSLRAGRTPLSGPSRRMLGESAPYPMEGIVTDACNRFADWAAGHAALVLESVDALDGATLESLCQILQRPGWLRLPLVLITPEPPSGPMARLADSLEQDALVELRDQAPAPFEPKSLPAGVLRVLRAGSVFGATFQAAQVAELLDQPIGAVLEQLQVAADAGAPLIDRGDGRFSLPRTAVKTLQAQTLPSLLAFWHERVGRQLARAAHETIDEPATARRQPSEPTPTGGPKSPSHAGLFETEPDVTTPDVTTPDVTTPDAAIPVFEPSGPAELPFDDSLESGPDQARPDQARAAAHLQASGRTEAAVERYLAAVIETAAQGDARRALSLAEQGLQLLGELPPTAGRALLHARLLLEAGRVQWQAVVLGTPFTLQAALESLRAARRQLPDTAPAELLGELAATTAGVCYDLGDQASLTGSLDELAATAQHLLSGGEPLAAARLLNEQAALLARSAQPLRAAELLARSRTIFESRLQQDPTDRSAIEELAQTYHLLARLPLHARVQSGREPEAYASALEHARVADQAYRRLGQRRPLAHVQHTMGRLELARGRLEAAGQHLSAALDSQRELGDVTGLARTAAALAELSIAAGRTEEAVRLLGDSIALNADKGSPIGLAFNRKTLNLLTEALARGSASESARTELEMLERRLAEAESVFGRLSLPR